MMKLQSLMLVSNLVTFYCYIKVTVNMLVNQFAAYWSVSGTNNVFVLSSNDFSSFNANVQNHSFNLLL